MREMREPQDAEQQRDPDRAQRIDAADDEAGEEIQIDEIAEGVIARPTSLPPGDAERGVSELEGVAERDASFA